MERNSILAMFTYTGVDAWQFQVVIVRHPETMIIF